VLGWVVKAAALQCCQLWGACSGRGLEGRAWLGRSKYPAQFRLGKKKLALVYLVLETVRVGQYTRLTLTPHLDGGHGE